MRWPVLHLDCGYLARKVVRCLHNLQEGRRRKDHGANRHKYSAAHDAVVNPDTAAASVFYPRRGAEKFRYAKRIEQLLFAHFFVPPATWARWNNYTLRAGCKCIRHCAASCLVLRTPANLRHQSSARPSSKRKIHKSAIKMPARTSSNHHNDIGFSLSACSLYLNPGLKP